MTNLPRQLRVVPIGTAPLERPNLAAWIACIASMSGVLERSLAGILVDVMEAHSPQAMAMYLALSGSQARKAALFAAAKRRLTDEEYKELVSVHKSATEKAWERNSVIHGAWAAHAACPDALLLCDPASVVLFEMAQLELFSQPFPTSAAEQTEFEKKLTSLGSLEYKIYEEEDLRAIAKRLNAAISEVGRFRNKLRAKYRWKLAEPESDLMDILRQQTTSEEPPSPDQSSPT